MTRVPDPDGYIEVTGLEGCFPSPEEVGEGVRGVVTVLLSGEESGTYVAADGSWSARIWFLVTEREVESGEGISVHTHYPNGKDSLPCMLVVP